VGGTPLPAAAQKKRLRQQCLSARAALSPAARAAAARRATWKLLRSGRLQRHRARLVAVYLSCGSEMPTPFLIRHLRRRGWRLVAPRILPDGGMVFVPLRRGDRPRRGLRGVPTPTCSGPRVACRRLSAVILPLSGFDDSGGRIGLGGGYYDRTLAGHPAPHRIGWALEAQSLDKVPVEPWDLRLHTFATERRSRPCRRV
jgi:5,10-methenyltetrahydrofolate synthetase